DARAGTQRGKPRSRRPQENPLGARVFDMDCGWPMYRSTNHGSWKYACGLYTQSTGARCRSNHVDGAAAVRLILSCIRQRVLYPDLLAKLEARLRGMAEGEAAAHAPAAKLQKHRAELRVIEEKLKIVSGNMALATTPQRFDVVAKVFDELTAQRIALQDLIATAQRSAATAVDPAAEVAAAMAVVKRLADLASEPDSLTAAGELFAALNARLFVRFGNFPQGGRILRKPSGGFVTFGDAPPPIDVYSGRTDRRSVRSTAQAGALSAPATCDVVSTGHEGDSLGKGRRGTP
ncbi:MAG: Resolvase domain protein, partial [Phycisphaerales bacterium]|nr:Resolvase domain protein [Phycisphaerales bacterium]